MLYIRKLKPIFVNDFNITENSGKSLKIPINYGKFRSNNEYLSKLPQYLAKIIVDKKIFKHKLKFYGNDEIFR